MTLQNISGTPTSAIFRMSHKRLAATLLYLYGGWPIASLSLFSLIALAVGICLDIRWLIVFLMVVCILSPLTLSFLYFYHGLRLSTASNVVSHTFTSLPSGLNLTLYPEPTEQDDTFSESDDTRQGKMERLYPFSIIEKCISGRDGFILTLAQPEGGFLWLPYDAFDIEVMEDMVSKIRGCSGAEHPVGDKV